MERRKVLIGIIIGMIILINIGMISAISQETYIKMGFWNRLKYDFFSGNMFTSWGESNCCSTEPDNNGEIIAEGDRVDCNDYCSYDKCAIDVWYDNRIFLGGAEPDYPDWQYLIWYDEIHGEGVSFTAPSTHQFWYVEVYCCPSSCSIGDWSTRVYVCEDGDWDYKGTYDSDEYCEWDVSGEDLCWCNEETENFYVDEGGNVHCRDSPRDSWCTEYIAHYEKRCVGDGSTEWLYWYDNRGERNDLIETCSSDERCTVDGCVPKDTGDVRLGHNEGDCDVLGIIDLGDDCQSGLVCIYNPSGNDLCCYSGEIIENNQCTPSGNDVGDGEVGDSCDNDVDCKSGYCDKSNWYSLGKTCQPTPWDKTYKIAMTRSQIRDATTVELISIACTRSEYCLTPSDEYIARCISLSRLKDDGDLLVGTSSFFDEANNMIRAGAVGGLIGAGLCAGSITATVILAPTVAGSSVAGAAAATWCTSLVVGGALIGATDVGYSEKDEIVEYLKAEDADAVGLCVAEPEGGVSENILDEWFKWAALFDVNRDGIKDGTDGLIIIIILIILMRIIF